MTDKMLKFVKIGQQTPPKRGVDNRKDDFNEIYDEFITQKAQEQSSRCSQCGVPFCQVHCPLSNNIPDWLKLTAEGRLKEAYELSQSTNNMPEVCGRICPQDRLCEGNCVIEQSGHGTVTIGSVEKYITDSAWENGWVKPISIKHEKEQSVGIIGAGPAGLAAAEQLRKNGYQITVYDRYDRAGGLLIYGIPNFKLEKHVVERRTKLLKDGGIKFEQNFEVFHPDRIANRILGMGDIVSLVEKAAQDLGEENIKKTEENLKKGQFSMQDYLTQLRQMKKMGGIEGIMSFMPGISKVKSQMDSAGIDESVITKNEAIILSMTKKERENPKIIDGSRKKRIANGSGTDPATINKLLKQFKMMSEMMRKMSKGNLKGMSDKGIPPELFNQLK